LPFGFSQRLNSSTENGFSRKSQESILKASQRLNHCKLLFLCFSNSACDPIQIKFLLAKSLLFGILELLRITPAHLLYLNKTNINDRTQT